MNTVRRILDRKRPLWQTPPFDDSSWQLPAQGLRAEQGGLVAWFEDHRLDAVPGPSPQSLGTALSDGRDMVRRWFRAVCSRARHGSSAKLFVAGWLPRRQRLWPAESLPVSVLCGSAYLRRPTGAPNPVAAGETRCRRPARRGSLAGRPRSLRARNCGRRAILGLELPGPRQSGSGQTGSRAKVGQQEPSEFPRSPFVCRWTADVRGAGRWQRS
jgi:hypothetical protein